MPTPGEGETRREWLDRCIPALIREGRKQDQAAAICHDMWRRKEMDEDVKTRLWNALTSWEALQELFAKEKPMKTVDGKKYPASDFLVAEDPQEPSTWHLPVKRNGKPNHRLMGAAWAALHKGYRGNTYQGPGKQEAITKLKRLYKSEGMELPATKEGKHNPFMVWKEKDHWRWLAVFSNKFRDEDAVPEILSEAAHKDFVAAVDNGEWPMPELWLWHVKGSKSGAADFVAYDDSGFSLASGVIWDEKRAEALSHMDDLLTSHGMPVKEIERDEEDPTIITRYRTAEISPLPEWAAANKYNTGFRILKEADEMSLPDEKRGFLEKIMEEGDVAALERQLEDMAKELAEQGVEFKEGEAQEEVVEEQAEEPQEDAPEYVTREEVVGVFTDHVGPLRQEMQALASQVAGLTGEIKALKEADEAKIAKTIEETPAASLTEMVGSAIGRDETRVDGRTQLAKAGPEQAQAPQVGPTVVPWLNDLMARRAAGG